MRRFAMVVLAGLAGCMPVVLPPGSPAIPDGARSVYVSGDFGAVRGVLVSGGFSIEDADVDAGFIRTGTLELPLDGMTPTLLRVYASEAGDGVFVLRGEWTLRTMSEWYHAGWESNRARLAFVKIVEVAMALDSASMEVRIP